MSWLESLFQDARFGVRMLRKEPAVTAAVVFSLSLAIGACTAAFSLIDALMLRPLPVPIRRLWWESHSSTGLRFRERRPGTIASAIRSCSMLAMRPAARPNCSP